LPPLEEPLTGHRRRIAATRSDHPRIAQSQTGEITGADTPAGDELAVDIITDPQQLPEPARRMRELILDAAATGDPEKLRALLGTGPNATQLAFSEIESDPVDLSAFGLRRRRGPRNPGHTHRSAQCRLCPFRCRATKRNLCLALFRRPAA
jgi:hypothetical protein